MIIQCFMLEDLRQSRYSLRRYVGSDKMKCPLPQGYHTARSAPICDRPDKETKPGDPFHGCHGTNPPPEDRADPRWPKACACGYAFAPVDTWQVFSDGLYRRKDTGEVVTWDDAPAGAVCEALWWRAGEWMVKLPDGSYFLTCQKANNCNCPDEPAHRCWKVTGTPPNLTASPSIMTPRWHGYLTEGKLRSV